MTFIFVQLNETLFGYKNFYIKIKIYIINFNIY